MENRIRQSLSVLLFAWLLYFATASAAADCTPQFAKIVSVQGEIEVKRAGTSNWHPVNRNDVFCPGDSIRVGEKSRAAIVMPNETLLRLDQNSAILSALISRGCTLWLAVAIGCCALAAIIKGQNFPKNNIEPATITSLHENSEGS